MFKFLKESRNGFSRSFIVLETKKLILDSMQSKNFFLKKIFFTPKHKSFIESLYKETYCGEFKFEDKFVQLTQNIIDTFSFVNTNDGLLGYNN